MITNPSPPPADVVAEHAVFAVAIANVVAVRTRHLDGAAQIAAHADRGDSAETIFYAGAKAMLDLVHAALRKGAPDPLVPYVVAQDEVAELLRPSAADLPYNAIVADAESTFTKCAGGSRPWASADCFASDAHIDEMLAAGAEILRGGAQ